MLKPTEMLRRSLPLLALIVALLGPWVQPAPAATGRGPWHGSGAGVDGVDRTAVKPQPFQFQVPSLLQASAKKRLPAYAGGSPDPKFATVATAVEQAIGAPRLQGRRCAYAYVPAPSAIVAQPRAPPSAES